MKTILVGLLALFFGGIAHAQDAMVVQTCGTLPASYAVGSSQLPTVDVNGKLCLSAISGTAIESFGASPSASAATNVAAFQAAFDHGGKLWLTTCGAYSLNATTYFGNNTDINVADCAVPTRTAADINLFQTKSTLTTPTTVTLAWTAGVTVTMTWTGHGQSVNSPICIRGTNQSVFNGPFLVASVTNANTLTYRTESLPTTGPTGTSQVVPCTYNVRWSGGTIDYNYPNVIMNSVSGIGNTAIRFGFAYNVRTENLKIINGGIYGINCGACRDFSFVNTTGQIAAGEFIKIYGPAYGGVIDGVSGLTADDGASVQTKEFAAFSANYRWTFGDVLGVQIRNVFTNSGTTSGTNAAVYFTASERMDNIKVSNVNGNASNPTLAAGLVYITSENITDTAGQITIENVRGWSTYSPIRFDIGTIENLIIDNVSPAGWGPITLFQNTGIIAVSSSAIIKNAHISNLVVPVATTWSGAGVLAGVLVTGEIDNITFDSPQALSGGNYSVLWAISGATLGNVTVNNPSMNSVNEIVQIQTGVLGSPTINVNGGIVTADSLVYSGSTAFINISGVNMPAIANGVVAADHTPTLTITTTGNVLTSGTWTHTFANSPVYVFRGLNQLTTQYFTTSANGTYTPAAGLVYAVVECVGQGGGGGGAAASATGVSSGGGGGAGSYSRVKLTSTQIGASQAVTNTAAANGGGTGNNPGTAGNDTSLGTLCIGKGGSGGGGAATTASGTSGAGGVAGTGDFTVVGNAGGRGEGATITTSPSPAGSGAVGHWGGAPAPVIGATSAVNGNAGAACGAGGGGGSVVGSASTAAGGQGGNGCVTVTEYNAN